MKTPNIAPIINLETIKEFLPHREPILLLDQAYNWQPTTLAATMQITPQTRWFEGHFPGEPTLPGVVSLEAMAQTAALHVGLEHNLPASKTIYYFLSIENARFRQAVTKPGTLVMVVKRESRRGDFYKYSGKAYFNVNPADTETHKPGALIAEATFMAKLVIKE